MPPNTQTAPWPEWNLRVKPAPSCLEATASACLAQSPTFDCLRQHGAGSISDDGRERTTDCIENAVRNGSQLRDAVRNGSCEQWH